MYAVTVPNKTGIIAVRGVEFNEVPSSLEIKASGNGIIEVRRDRPDGEVIASIKVGTPQMKLIESQLQTNMTGTMDLCFILKGNNITFDEWKFKWYLTDDKRDRGAKLKEQGKSMPKPSGHDFLSIFRRKVSAKKRRERMKAIENY